MNDDNNTVQKLLCSLGFSQAVADTYWALLNLESVSVRKVSEFSGINRGTTYEAIKQLQNIGLVRARRSGQREYYAAESPTKIHDIIRDQRKNLLRNQREAESLIPQLLARKAQPLGQPLVKYYEGDEGIVSLLRDVLQTAGQLDQAEYCVYSSRPLRQYLYRKFPDFTKRRIEENIFVRVIAVGEGGDPASSSQRRWINEPEDIETSSYSIIYGNKVAIIALADGYTPYAVVIEDPGSAAMQRLLFDNMWRFLDEA